MTTVRHPLTDLPLDKFISFEHKASLKRPLSPNTTLLSPSKRRLLSAEGLYSPEKRRNSTPSKQLFSNLVGSPPSPARRLDFTTLSHPSPRKASAKRDRDASPRPETPVSHSGSLPKLAPSPEIASSSSLDASRSTRLSDNVTPKASHDYPLPAPMIIPREMPTFAEPLSIHHPGFDVHPDTFLTIPTSQTILHTTNAMDASNPDEVKENVRPKKRVGKRVAPETPSSGKPVKISRIEKQEQDAGGINIMAMLTPSPGKRAMTRQEKQEGRKHMRLIMELEMDEEDDVDNQL